MLFGSGSQINYHYLTWLNIEEAVNKMATSMRAHNYKPKKILGIARGGMVPAAMLSHALDVQEVHALRLQSYQETEQKASLSVHIPFDLLPGVEPVLVMQGYQQAWNTSQALIVDDIYDSGRTMGWVKSSFPEAVTATLFFKEKRPPVAWPGLHLKRHDSWYVFPWEKDPSNGKR